MELTKEQKAIIQSSGNIKINAVAGSGKTTTVIEYAATRPKNSRILYLAFNKSVKLEAVKKFETKGLGNVKVETAHSLAYKNIVYKNNYTVRSQDYKTYEISELLGLKGNGEKHTEYILANHIHKFIAYFCNSAKERVQDLSYLDVVNDEKARVFVKTFYAYIQNQARILLAKMDKGEVEITHDFYLKKFQLSNPVLEYDYILFDEGQDASPAMLDVFLRQKATKVIVGDTHQQIYGWRFAVNSLEKADFKTYYLTKSFRFDQDIANLAIKVLDWKSHLSNYTKTPIEGHGKNKTIQSKTVIARTNLGLLLKAIEYVTEKKELKSLYFEGNINSYTYADEGASLYDVLHLYNENNTSIKDKLLKAMRNLDELEEYIKKTEDVQLGMMVEIVKKYGNSIPKILNLIKQKHIENNVKEDAEMIFSTVHRCKGMEYDAVQLVDDFITEEKLIKLKASKDWDESSIPKLNEEINLLYVAITRTANTLYIPESYIPKDFKKSPFIKIMKMKTEAEKKERYTPNSTDKKKDRQKSTELKEKPKSNFMDKVRQTHEEAYKPWTKELDNQLMIMYGKGSTIEELAKLFKRTPKAIFLRIEKLESEEAYRQKI